MKKDTVDTALMKKNKQKKNIIFKYLNLLKPKQYILKTEMQDSKLI